MLNKRLALSFDTPPQTPVSRHYIGDPDVSLVEVSDTEPNMANHAVFLKLPEFWETSAAAWFANMQLSRLSYSRLSSYDGRNKPDVCSLLIARETASLPNTWK